MKIGFGTTVLEKGLSQGHMDGIGVYTKNLWEALDREKRNSKLEREAISFGKNYISKETDDILGDIIHISPSYPIQSARSMISGNAFYGVESIEQDIDLFFAPDHHIPKLNHTPVIATIHDAYPLIYPKLVSRKLRKWKNIAFKRASHWADHIITISEHSKRDIIQYFTIPEERITVIPNGVNQAFMVQIPEAEKEAVCRRYAIEKGFFVFIGTIQPRKNLSRVIAAYESLPAAIRQRHSLLIIGHYGWGEEDLKKKLDNLEKEETIRWIKSVTDYELYALLQSALAMVYPSLYEGFGLPVLEGFASKIPVITSESTSIPEVAGDAACYVDPLKTTDIALKMKHIAQDAPLREMMIEKGWRRVKEFSWEKSAREHVKVFEKIYTQSR